MTNRNFVVHITWQSNRVLVWFWLQARFQSVRLSPRRITLSRLTPRNRPVLRGTSPIELHCARRDTDILLPTCDCRDNLSTATNVVQNGGDELTVKVVDNHKMCTINVCTNLTGIPAVIFVDNTLMNCFPAVTGSIVEPLSPPACRKRRLMGAANGTLV